MHLRLTTALAGVLWAVFGVCAMLTPLGRHTAHDAGRGYDVVVDRVLYTLYALPGALAVLLSAAALLGIASGAGRLLGAVAAALGAVALGGVAAAFDPLFMGPQILGTLALGAAACAASRGLSGGASHGLLALGLAGVASLGLWPLVWAVELLPPAGGALMLALFGLGWAAVGRGAPSARAA